MVVVVRTIDLFVFGLVWTIDLFLLLSMAAFPLLLRADAAAVVVDVVVVVVVVAVAVDNSDRFSG